MTDSSNRPEGELAARPELADHDKEIEEKIREADYASKDKHVVSVAVSRQDYKDLLEAMRFIRQINRWYASVGRRLDKLAVRIRDGLDQNGVA